VTRFTRFDPSFHGQIAASAPNRLFAQVAARDAPRPDGSAAAREAPTLRAPRASIGHILLSRATRPVRPRPGGAEPAGPPVSRPRRLALG
jgi:hypothetical protein